jgi:hypothetical protein
MRAKILIIILAVAMLAGGGVVAWRQTHKTTTANKSAGTSQQATPSTTPPPSGMQPATETPKTYQVKVYFSKHPQSDNDPGAVFAVNRTTDNLGVAKFTVGQILAGPTTVEQTAGYFTTARLRSDTSNCNGQDFKITIVNGTATLQFCRTFDHLGVVADGQAKSELEATLKQFSSVKKVVILNKNGNCEFDLSGMDLCKQ